MLLKADLHPNMTARKLGRLLIAESSEFSPKALSLLNEHFEVACEDFDRAGLLNRVADANVLWVRLRNRIDAEVMDHAPHLRMIATNTTGLNHIDLEAAEARNIRVLSLRGEVEFLKDIRATAELTLGLTLALLRQIPAAHQHVMEGSWDRYLFRGVEVYRRTVGILGYGRLGRIVAKYFQALGANVLVASRELQSDTVVDGFPVVATDDLLSKSDIVSLHVNYEPANHHMIGVEQFHRMKPDAYFINTSRGELVDETALLLALEREQIRGAALDVLDDEYAGVDARKRLIEFARRSNRLLITPHIGGNTADSTQRTEEFLAEKLVATVRVAS